MKRFNTRGFIAIEVVITASFILAVGFFALINFSTSGTSLMDTMNGRLAGLGIFGGITAPEVETVYDGNGYPEHLNINPADITPEANFEFAWDAANNGWGITRYLDDGRTSVIAPASRSDGLPVVSIMNDTWGWDQSHITSILLPNTIKRIGDYGLAGIYVSNFVIPNSVTEIGEGAFG
jgi:asparagine N-glycosylation enzyme membrane subunit Stt3